MLKQNGHAHTIPRSLPVTLVIPLRNEEQSLPGLIRTINEQTYGPDEILLVDGGSTDDTIMLAKRLTAHDSRYRILEADNATPGIGRNIGIAAARTDWIALTDAGILLDSKWLEELVKIPIHETGVCVVFGHYEPIVDSLFEKCAALAYSSPLQHRGTGRMRGPSTASLLLHKQVWVDLGGFPNHRASEDLIFFEKIERQQYKIGWAPSAIVHWQLQPTLRKTFSRFTLYSKHNVWAGRQRYWHYGILRQYLLALPFLLLGFGHSWWWLFLPAIGFMLRIGKTIWVRLEPKRLSVFFNPIQFLLVGLILLCIDLATMLGWLQANLSKPQGLPQTNWQ